MAAKWHAASPKTPGQEMHLGEASAHLDVVCALHVGVGRPPARSRDIGHRLSRVYNRFCNRGLLPHHYRHQEKIMATITAFVIPAEHMEIAGVRDIDGAAALDALQKAVGGYVEALHLPTLAADMFINEEAKIYGLARNTRATGLAGVLYSGLALGDYIAGDAIITGGPNEDGDATSLDPLQVHELNRALQQI